jgi:CubicO group peptidase (beta-lactamase class C family)
MEEYGMQNGLWKKGLVLSIVFLFVIGPVSSCYGQIPIYKKIVQPGQNRKSEFDLNFDQKITFYMKLGHIPGLSACIIKNSTVQWSNGYGCADKKTFTGATPDTIYQVASISKSICAVAVMQLLEQKLIGSLDDDVNNYLDFSLRNPGYPNVSITFRMLLAHLSSLVSDDVIMFISFSLLGYPRAWLKEFLIPTGRFYTPKIWYNCSPGQECNYSSLNFEVLAYLVERISHQPYEQYVTEHIFRPLNMSSTSYSFSDLNISRLAAPYLWEGFYIQLPLYNIRNAGAGGAKSTVMDLAHLLIIHMNGGMYSNTSILNSTSIEEIHRAQYSFNTSNNFSMGLGWYSFRMPDGSMCGGHDGTVPGARSTMRMRYKDNVGVIFIFNRWNYKLNGQIVEYARKAIEQLLFDKAETLSLNRLYN